MLRHAWLIAVVAAAPVAAQSGAQGDTWESIAKLPDFGGLWEITFGVYLIAKGFAAPERRRAQLKHHAEPALATA